MLQLDITTLCQATDRTSDDLENKQDVINVEEKHMNSSKIGIASAKSGRTAQFSSPKKKR
jgi:hypothetical protein